MSPIRDDEQFDESFDRLLAFHLGGLTDEEREAMESELASDPEARNVSQQIESMLSPLESLEDIPVPAGLKQKILLAAKTPPLTVESLLNDMSDSKPLRIRVLFNRFVDFAATAAAVLMIGTAVLLSSGYARQQARKVFCAGNLGVVGSAVASYANDFSRQLPFAYATSTGAWYDNRTGQPHRPHLYILVKRDYLPTQFLLCPEEAVKLRLLAPNELYKLNDFPSSVPVSYSFQNLFGDQTFTPQQRQLRWQQAQNLAIMADRSPLLSNNMMIPEPGSGSVFSQNHGRLRGQNVLSLDGHVSWQTTPYFGQRKDNIWQAGSIQQYSGKEVPTDPTDSFLAP